MKKRINNIDLKSNTKKFKHNEYIANELKDICGEQLRGTPYYKIKELMNSTLEKKNKIQEIVKILNQNNIIITKNIKILLKNID